MGGAGGSAPWRARRCGGRGAASSLRLSALRRFHAERHLPRVRGPGPVPDPAGPPWRVLRRGWLLPTAITPA